MVERAAALAATFEGDLEVHTELGQGLQRIGQYAEALVSYERALQLAPGNVHVLRYEASMLAMLGRYDEARAVYLGLSTDPNPTYVEDGWEGVARMHRLAGNPRAAIDVARAGLAKYPDDDDLWHELGHAYAAVEEWSEALEAFARAARLEPDSMKHAHNVAWCQGKLGRMGGSRLGPLRARGLRGGDRGCRERRAPGPCSPEGPLRARPRVRCRGPSGRGTPRLRSLRPSFSDQRSREGCARRVFLSGPRLRFLRAGWYPGGLKYEKRRIALAVEAAGG